MTLHPHLGDRLLPYRGPEDDPVPLEGEFLASVAVILREGPAAPEILLVRRALLERDPWSGHMALPGGKKEARDASLMHTAIRETGEETAIPPERLGMPLGRLGLVAPRNPNLPLLSVVPFVFIVPAGTSARVASPELSEVLWVPIPRLMDPGSRATYRHRLGEITVPFPAFDLGGRIVWGLTHRVLEDLLGRVATFEDER